MTNQQIKEVKSRAKTRLLAFKLIFGELFVDAENEALLLQNLIEDEKINDAVIDNEYLTLVMDSFHANLVDLKNELAGAVSGYEIDRIYKIDLALLYLALIELKYVQTPKAVIVNEILEIAKKYSSDKSHTFINGVLAKIN